MNNNDAENKVIDILNNKLKYLKEILRLTKNVNITGLSTDAEIFTKLTKRRKSFYDKIYNLDSIIKNKYPSISNKSIVKIKSEIKKISKEIMILMENHSLFFEPILNNLKSEIKHVNNSKNIQNRYRSEIGTVYNSFDVSQ